jgi:subtilisin family serine protease
MKRTAIGILLFIVPLSVFGAYTPRQSVLVMTNPSGHASAKTAFAFDPATADERDLREFSAIRGFAANLTDDEIAMLKSSGNVISIEPDGERHAFTDTVTPGQQTIPYGLNAINASLVWPVTRGKSLNGGPAIHVAIIDTGIDYKNPELAAAFKEGYNFVARTSDPLDDAGHGSHVAGTIAAANDQSGVVGIASDVDIYSLKVLNGCGSGRTSDIIQAVDWVVQKKKAIGGNWIVNLSLGSDTASDAEKAEFQAASDAGILVFAASGNSYDGTTDGLAYPAGYPTVVSVGAVDVDRNVASFSQRGADLKLVAPGKSVLSTFLNGLLSVDDGRKISANFPSAALSSGDAACLSHGPATAKFVACGKGNPSEIPTSVTGKIALIERGGVDATDPTGATALGFLQKTRNALAKGAIGVVVYSDDRPVGPITFGTVKSTDVGTLPPMGLIGQADGLALLATPNATLTLRFDQQGSTEEFDLLEGTSMACPHAVGAAALAWAVSPNSTASNVATALEQTALDLGDFGKDNTYGYGEVSAYHAAIRLNPAAFPVHGRMAGRRGH